MIEMNILGESVTFTSKELRNLLLDILALYDAPDVAKIIVESAGTDLFFAGDIANSIQRRLKKRANLS